MPTIKRMIQRLLTAILNRDDPVREVVLAQYFGKGFVLITFLNGHMHQNVVTGDELAELFALKHFVQPLAPAAP